MTRINNSSKTVTATKDKLCITYDNSKYQWIEYDNNSPFQSIQQGTTFSKRESLSLNPNQVKLYRKALYGIEALTPEEVKQLTFQENLRITRLQNKCQRLINKWKQEITNNVVLDFFTLLFPKSSLTKAFSETKDYTTDKEINPLPFRKLGITQKSLVEKMIEWEVLPKNFYQIN